MMGDYEYRISCCLCSTSPRCAYYWWYKEHEADGRRRDTELYRGVCGWLCCVGGKMCGRNYHKVPSTVLSVQYNTCRRPMKKTAPYECSKRQKSGYTMNAQKET